MRFFCNKFFFELFRVVLKQSLEGFYYAVSLRGALATKQTRKSIKKAVFLTLMLFCFIASFSSASSVVANGNKQKISVDFSDIKTSDLLRVLAKQINKNIIVSEKIKGKTTISLNNVFWREALDAVLNMQGLVKHETDGVIVILTARELEESSKIVSMQKIFNLRHTSAEKIAKLLKLSGVLSKHGKLGAEAETNSLVISDNSNNLDKVKKLIKRLDVPVKQVLIEARIVSVDEMFLRELGLEFNNYAAITTNGLKRIPLVIERNQSQFSFSINKIGDNSLLDLELAALEKEGRGKVISKPKLLTADRKEAYIEAGTEIPYQEKTKKGHTSVSFKKAVLSLKVMPEIVAKDKIKLSLELSQDKVGQLVINGVPAIDTRKIQTQVLVGDNETIVLGGIYEWTKRNYTTGIPFLKQIPLLKILFSKKKTKIEKKELLIFVTPKIVG